MTLFLYLQNYRATQANADVTIESIELLAFLRQNYVVFPSQIDGSE